MFLATLNILALLSLTSALPSPPHLFTRRADPVAQLIAIAPTSGSCANAAFPAECATASQAVAPLISMRITLHSRARYAEP